MVRCQLRYYDDAGSWRLGSSVGLKVSKIWDVEGGTEKLIEIELVSFSGLR